MSQFITFIVEGNGECFVYMLRYDSCFPQQQPDARSVGLNLHFNPEEYRKRRRVTLLGYKKPTVARWESFSWKVVMINGEIQ